MYQEVANDVDQDIRLGKIDKNYRSLAIRHRLINEHNRLNKLVPFDPDADTRTSPSPEEILITNDWKEGMPEDCIQCWHALNEYEQALLWDHAVEDKSVRDLEFERGVPKSTINRHINRILKKLRDCIAKPAVLIPAAVM